MTPTPLVLLHGALGTAAQFDALRAAIARLTSGVVVHAPDFAGHGTAPAGDRPFHPVAFAESVRELLDRHAVARAAVFGYSMGGYVALALAAASPDRVARVMTLGTKFRWTPDVAAREARMLDPRRMEEKVPHFARALAERHTAAGWEQVLAGTREMMHALGAHPLLDDAALGRIAVPVRVGVGDRDATVSVEESAAVARLLPAGELEVLPHTPHPFEKVAVERLARSIVEVLAAG